MSKMYVMVKPPVGLPNVSSVPVLVAPMSSGREVFASGRAGGGVADAELVLFVPQGEVRAVAGENDILVEVDADDVA